MKNNIGYSIRNIDGFITIITEIRMFYYYRNSILISTVIVYDIHSVRFCIFYSGMPQI